MTEHGVPDARRADLAAALASVSERIRTACREAGRPEDEVELLAVTKYRPASDVALLLDLGLRGFGENRPQEAAAKVPEVAALRPEVDARWHQVGRLQRNKARSVAEWAFRVESVDSERLVDALDAAVTRALDGGERSERLSVLLQLSLDGDPQRGGVVSNERDALAERVMASEALELHGVMAVAPLNTDPDRAFASLEEASGRLRSQYPHARVISAGMTADLERAIRFGSTCVRVGTALLGDRRLTSP
ncbi:YggS family pyridoxal phosphate-dependent enzyme [Pseudonocardia spinosispora]|uniref:YggS family pyridoxal phosphate-dependent enzyme n=1 Tax=Pseudonocardia spinosispora TaxID=103441 RepID=UPI0012EBB1E6|nr:YggS family pyridoxal phosphate-dependent enzyme [Pseudonocardia spinosispora]